MVETEVTGEGATVTLTVDELMVINNALNEVCNGLRISDSEFQTRMAVERDEARAVLNRVNDLWRHAARGQQKAQSHV